MARAVTSLGFIEEKLRRMLGLTSEVGTTFAPSITPSIHVGDATGPGYNRGAGRRWMGTINMAAAAASQILVVRFQTGCVVDGWYWWQSTAANLCQVNYSTADLADPAGSNPNTLFAPYTEIGTVAAERAPLLRSTWVSVAPNGQPIWSHQFISNSGIEVRNPMHMPAGSRLIFVSTLAMPTCLVSLYGKVFE